MTDHLNDTLDDLFTASSNVVPLRPRPTPPADYKALPELYEELCSKCNGSGKFVGYSGRTLGNCFACKGTGRKMFKTSFADREKSRASASARKAKKAEDRGREIEAYINEHKALVDFLARAAKQNADRGGDFLFPQNMLDAIAKYGSLTDNQLAACERMMARAEERKAEAVARAENAPAIKIEAIEAAFSAARSSGLKYLRLNLGEFTFKPAGMASKNPGAIYVTRGEEYLGKIKDGRFFGVRSCSPDTEAAILAAAADPKAAAIAHGKRTGSCSCCGRELTNPESIELGIGPVCASRFGW